MSVYSSLKIFHFPEKLNSLPREQAITAPVHIRWKPTNRCNHRCRYCAYRDDALQLGQDMSELDVTPREKALEIARDIVAMGVRAVTFSGGGEPLAFPHLLEVGQVLHDGGVKLATLTNGALLAGELAAFFARNAVWVRVSMDGWDDASYSRYRGIKDGEYSRIMRNIEKFSALGGDCVLGVSLIVDAENAVHVPESLRRLKEAGVSSVKVSACVVSNDAAENNAYHAPHFALVRDHIARAKNELEDAGFEIVDAWHTLDDRFNKGYDWCPFSQVLAVIGADLGVYPCQDKAYNKDALLGSLDGQSFRQFWETGKQRFFMIQPCRDCVHHCVANDKNKMILDYLQQSDGHGDFV